MSEPLTGRQLDAAVHERVFGHREFSYLGMPDYSGSWAGAGLVVERMRELGWQGCVTMPNENGPWGAEFWKGDAMDTHGEADHEAAPVAVSRAALAALSSEATRG